MQHEILEEKALLNEYGELSECGYSKKMLLKYDRKSIKANKLRIKEWDYYLIYNDKFGLALTVADNSYMGLYSATFLDFTNTATQDMHIAKFAEHETGSHKFIPFSAIIPASSTLNI